MKTEILILSEPSEAALQTAIQNLIDKEYIMVGFPQVELDSSDNEIWYCTMQGQIQV